MYDDTLPTTELLTLVANIVFSHLSHNVVATDAPPSSQT